ncbi:CsiV family protein [Kaarinaea lacus]
MKRNQSIQYLSWLIIALTAPNITFAGNKDENDVPWYQVEIIIFANQDQQGMISETWPEPTSITASEFHDLIHPEDTLLQGSTTKTGSKAPDFSASATSKMPTPFELMNPSELQLIPIAKKLKSSSKYKTLLHIGWRQPTLHPDDSIPIFIYQGVDTPMVQDPTNMSAANSAGNKDTAKGNRFSTVPVTSVTYDSSQYGQLMSPSEIDVLTGPDLNPFYGTLRLSVSRYLHLEANLNYRVPVVKEEMVPVNMEDAVVGSGFQQNVAFTEQGDAAEMRKQIRRTLQNFNMFETRRMRSKEIHYFDHPLLGIIARVIPYEIPVNEPDFDPASQAFTSGGGSSGAAKKPTVKSPQ